MKNVYVF